jgi:hypothetical protein
MKLKYKLKNTTIKIKLIRQIIKYNRKTTRGAKTEKKMEFHTRETNGFTMLSEHRKTVSPY